LKLLVENQGRWAEVVSHEDAPITCVVGLAVVVSVRIVSVAKSAAVLHHSAGRRDHRHVVTFASVLVICHIHITSNDAALATDTHAVRSTPDLIVTVYLARTVHAQSNSGQEDKDG